MSDIKYSLRGVSINQFATLFEAQSDNIELNLNVPIKTNYGERSIAVGANIQFKENGNTFLALEVYCHYEIDSDSWEELSERRTRSVTLPKELMNNLSAISIGAARGVLCAKTENTSFSKYFIPIVMINLKDGEDLVISK